MNLCDYYRDRWLGKAFHYLPRVDSTNDWLMAAAQQGAPEGMVVVAEEQSRGRGRMARRWYAPPGTSLLMSLLFRPPEPFTHFASRVTMLCGVSLLEAIRSLAPLPLMLKWPNDLIVKRGKEKWRKLAGMLSEIGLEKCQPSFLVVGVGLNVNLCPDQLAELAPNATSLSAEIGDSVDRCAVLDAFLARVDARYMAMRAGKDPLSEWRLNLAWMGQPVYVQTPTAHVRGIAETVDENGALGVRCPGGTRQWFSVGDVSLRPGNFS